MKTFIKQSWVRFKSKVPAAERKLQIILGAAAASFGSMAAISFPGKLFIVGTAAGYIASACGGMAFLLQFAMQTQVIVETKDEVKLTATSTTTVLPVAANEEANT